METPVAYITTMKPEPTRARKAVKDVASPSTKDVQTITTTDRNEEKAWAKQKSDEGYAVARHYDNGVYTCVAVS